MPRRVDLQALPQLKDGWSFLYVDKVRVDREDNGIVLQDERGHTRVPAAALSTLLLGPGTTITHGAVVLLADHGCSVAWCGEDSVRLYASGLGETRRAANLEQQARLWASPEQHLEVVRRMYRMRFAIEPAPSADIQQLRGMEGARVRDAYAHASRESGVPWNGRNYKLEAWTGADPINRALSVANACLYGVCHAAIVAIGCSPALGFIHTGKALSFVYDIADLYKADITIPAAFKAVAAGTAKIESRVRKGCRDLFHEHRVLERIVPDIQRVLGLRPEAVELNFHADTEPGALWDPDAVGVEGGRNHADDQ